MAFKTPLITGFALASLAVAPAFAQGTTGTAPDAAPPPPGATAGAAPTPPSATMDTALMSMTVDAIEDMDVHGADGQKIGEIEEIVRGPDGLMAVVEAGGGFLGIGGKNVLVPMAQFRMEGERLTLPVTEEQAKSMAEYTEGQGGYAEVENDDLALSEAATRP
ncbi:PRC-barrel domain-containing protein [Arenibaculum pallidiluteum]|uniref:PRC-barrel domain-containing protein n=1 Tax=Arenibaculum pallidiluteum TaxID=2812559 RepID=UPI001A97C392|nr:PRC-barrel domain-containing protein [Arenibaculum pallidiluteum]